MAVKKEKPQAEKVKISVSLEEKQAKLQVKAAVDYKNHSKFAKFKKGEK